MINTFSVIGGDSRNIELAKILAQDENKVSVYGLEKHNKEINDIKNIEICNSLGDAIEQSNIVIGPIPFSRDGETMNSPFSNVEIDLEDFASWLDKKILFAGSIPEKFYKIAKDTQAVITDIMKIEEIAILNIIATAEGAICKIIEETDVNLQGSNVLIIGFGRIGKILSKKLETLGAKVTCSARKQEDLAWIEAYGYNVMNTYNLQNLDKFDVIINTVPYIIFNKKILEQIDKHCLLLELASSPGGFDLDYIKKTNLKYIPALGLPGKVAPKASANYIKNFIYKTLIN